MPALLCKCWHNSALHVLEAGIEQEIESIQNSPPTAAEVERAKTSIEAARYRGSINSGLESPLGRAIAIADYSVFEHDPDLVNTELKRYLAVTPEQIQAAARRYFVPENRSTIEIQPGAGNPHGEGSAQ